MVKASTNPNMDLTELCIAIFYYLVQASFKQALQVLCIQLNEITQPQSDFSIIN